MNYSDEIAKLPDILIPIAIMDLIRSFIRHLESEGDEDGFCTET